ALPAASLAARFGPVLSAPAVRRYLQRAGWRWARPRLAPATYAPGRQRRRDPAAALKLDLIARALASPATVLYLDECELHLLPVLRACWMKGPRWRGPPPRQNVKRTPFCALNARTRQVVWTPPPRQRARAFAPLLQ